MGINDWPKDYFKRGIHSWTKDFENTGINDWPKDQSVNKGIRAPMSGLSTAR